MGLFENAMKVIETVKESTNKLKEEFSVWDNQTLRALVDGKISVPDDALNKYLTSLTSKKEEQELKELEFHSLGDNIIQLNAVTNKIGKVQMKFEIIEMKHNNEESFIKLELKSKELVDKSVLSWALSKMTAGMLSKFFGDINLGEGVTIKINGNMIMLDFRERLQESKAGKLSVKGQPLLNAVHINGVTAHKNYLEFSTALKVKQFLNGFVDKQ